MVEIITANLGKEFVAVQRTITTPISTKYYIILTPLCNSENIESSLEEEIIHFVLNKYFGYKVSKQLDNVIKFIQTKPYEELISILVEYLKEYPLEERTNINYSTNMDIHNNVLHSKREKKEVRLCPICLMELDELGICPYCDRPEPDYDNIFLELEDDLL